MRTSTLDRVSIGFRRTGDTLDVRTAGFAVDPTTLRAFVVGPDGTIAAVDLQTLAVSYHGGTSLYAAKPFPGPQRTARWLGNGLLAVAGNDGFTPSRLRIVDTRDWTVRVVDQSSENVTVAGGVAVGSNGPNYAGYSPDGTRRYRLALATGEDLQVAGRYGYVCASSKLRSVLDLSTGTPVSPTHGSVCVTVLRR